MIRLIPGSIALNNILMFQHLVYTDLFFDCLKYFHDHKVTKESQNLNTQGKLMLMYIY